MSKSLTLNEIKELKKDLVRVISMKIKDFNKTTSVKVAFIKPTYISMISEDGEISSALSHCEMELDYE